MGCPRHYSPTPSRSWQHLLPEPRKEDICRVILRRMSACATCGSSAYLSKTSSVPSSVLQAEPGFEYPGDHSQAGSQESHGHAHADADAHIGGPVKAPAEAADQVHDGIEQAEGAPGRRQHVDRIEGAAEEGERGDDQHGNELQLFETLGPDADDESEQAERECGHQ